MDLAPSQESGYDCRKALRQVWIADLMRANLRGMKELNHLAGVSSTTKQINKGQLNQNASDSVSKNCMLASDCRIGMFNGM